jgi:hypothetical protein
MAKSLECRFTSLAVWRGENFFHVRKELTDVLSERSGINFIKIISLVQIGLWRFQYSSKMSLNPAKEIVFRLLIRRRGPDLADQDV